MSKFIYKGTQKEEDLYSSYDSDDNEIKSPVNKKVSIIEMESFKDSRKDIIDKVNDLKRKREIKITHLNEKVTWSTIYDLFFSSHFTYFKRTKANDSKSKANTYNHDNKSNSNSNNVCFNLNEIQFRIKHLMNKFTNHIPANQDNPKKEICFPSINWIDEPLSRLINRNMIGKTDKNKYISSLIQNYPQSITNENERKPACLRKKTTIHLVKKSSYKLNYKTTRSLNIQSKKHVIPQSHALSDQSAGINNSSQMTEINFFDKGKVNEKRRREICPTLSNSRGINKFIKKYPKYEEEIELLKYNLLAYELILNNKEKNLYKDDTLNYHRHYLQYNLNQEELIRDNKNTNYQNKEHIKNTAIRSQEYLKIIRKMKE